MSSCAGSAPPMIAPAPGAGSPAARSQISPRQPYSRPPVSAFLICSADDQVHILTSPSPYGGSRQLTQCRAKPRCHRSCRPAAEAVPYRSRSPLLPPRAKLRSVTSGTAIAAAAARRPRGIAPCGHAGIAGPMGRSFSTAIPHRPCATDQHSPQAFVGAAGEVIRSTGTGPAHHADDGEGSTMGSFRCCGWPAPGGQHGIAYVHVAVQVHEARHQPRSAAMRSVRPDGGMAHSRYGPANAAHRHPTSADTPLFLPAFSFHRAGQGSPKHPPGMENPSSHSLKAPRSFPQAGQSRVSSHTTQYSRQPAANSAGPR